MPTAPCPCAGYGNEQPGKLTACRNENCKGNCSLKGANGGLCSSCLGKRKKREKVTNHTSESPVEDPSVLACDVRVTQDYIDELNRVLQELTTRRTPRRGLVEIDSANEIYIPSSALAKKPVMARTADDGDVSYDAFEGLDRDVKCNLIRWTDVAVEAASKELGKEYAFSAFSLIFSWKSEQQIYHIDLQMGAYQFALILTESESTIYSSATMSLEDACIDLGIDHFNDPTLKNFCSLLSPLNRIDHSSKSITDGPVTPGTLCMMEGGKIHAKPKNKGFRAVIFFSACPIGRRAYNPNEQYNVFSLLDEIYGHADSHEKPKIKMEFEKHLPYYKEKYGEEHLRQVLSRLPARSPLSQRGLSYLS